MNKLQLTSQFKKDLKRYKHKAAVLDKLEAILKLLATGAPIPESNRPHLLTGNYKGYMGVTWKTIRCLYGMIKT